MKLNTLDISNMLDSIKKQILKHKMLIVDDTYFIRDDQFQCCVDEEINKRIRDGRITVNTMHDNEELESLVTSECIDKALKL